MIIEDMKNLDTVRANLFQPLVIAEDDENSHVLIAQLLVNGKKLSVLSSDDCTVSLHYQRADGAVGVIAGTCTDEGKIRVPISDTVLELDDMVRCDICVNRRARVTWHTISIESGDLLATPITVVADQPLRTGLFKIDAQYRVII